MVKLKSVLVHIFPVLFGVMLLYSFVVIYPSPKLAVQLKWNTDHSRWQITNPPMGSSLQANDIIQKIDGIEIEFFHLLTGNDSIDTQQEFNRWMGAISPVLSAFSQPDMLWEIHRNGATEMIDVRPVQTGITFFKSISFMTVFIISVVFFSIGIISFSRMPLNDLGTTFLLFCTSFSILLFSMSLSTIHTANFIAVAPWFFKLINTINLLFYFLAPVFLFHFTMLLPRERALLKKRQWIVPFYYLINCIIAGVFNLEIMFMLVPVYFILSVLTIIHSYFVFNTPIERQQMKWVVMGFLFGIGPWILLNGLPGLLFGEELMSDYVPALFTICIPLFIAFAIRKYKLLYIDVLFEGTFVYGVTLMLLFVVDVGLIGMISSHYNHILHLTPSGKGLFSILFIVILYTPLRDRIQHGISRLFNRRPIDESKIVSDFNKTVSGRSPDKVLSTLKEVLVQTFRPQTIEIVGRIDHGQAGITSIPDMARPFLLWEDPPVFLSPRLESAVALPILTDQKIKFIVYLGYPQGNRLYSAQQVNLMTTLLIQANLLYNNAVLFADNIKQTRARLIEAKRNVKEKEKILKDLHDGIGGITTNINLLAEIGKTSDSISDTQKTFTSISELSRESLLEIRGFFNSLDTRDTDWREFITELNQFARAMLSSHNIEFIPQINTDNKTKDIPCESLVFLILFRIYKEALSNIVKHSGADRVDVFFSISPTGLVLRVHDNGCGFSGTHSAGRGVSNMKERARELSGTLAITSENGTDLLLEVPLPVTYTISEEQI